MGWSLFHERTAFVADLIERAAPGVEAAETVLDFSDDARAEVHRLFGDEDRLLLALRHKWVTALTAKLEQAAYEDVSAERARAKLAAAQPGLRALLDAAARRSVRLRAFERAEQHIVDYYAGPDVARRTVA